jgi:hypothetical protein
MRAHLAWAETDHDFDKAPPSLCLIGSPGGGKTSIARQAAQGVGATPLVFDPIQKDATEISGLPDVDRTQPERPLTVRTVPDLIGEMERITQVTNRPVFLVLDDLPSSNRTLMAAYSSTLFGRTMGGYALPRKTYVCATGNLSTDRVVYHDIPTNIHNRLVFVKLDRSLDDWCDHALADGLLPELVAAVREDAEILYEFDFRDPSTASSTPRSLYAVDQILRMAGLDEHMQQETIRGAIGEAPGAKLWARLTILKDMPKMAEILADPEWCRLPQQAGARYAISRALAIRMEVRTFDAGIVYLERMGRDFMVMALRMAMRETEGRERLVQRNKHWKPWAAKNGKLLQEMLGQ